MGVVARPVRVNHVEIREETMIPMWITQAIVIAVAIAPIFAYITYQVWVTDRWRGVVEFWGTFLGLVAWVGIAVLVGWIIWRYGGKQ
jgi:putative flippase GtrA